MDENQYNEIVNKHVEAARQEIEAEQRKSEQQRQAEATDQQIGTLSAQLNALMKDPLRNRLQIDEVQKQLAAAELQYGSLMGTSSLKPARYTADRRGNIR